MIAANYPGIQDEATTVEFLVDGLKHHPNAIDIGRSLIGMDPQIIKDFVTMYNRISAYNTVPYNSTPAPHPGPAPTHMNPPLYRPPRHVDHAPETQRPRHIPNPCSFHSRFMRRCPPLHTDAECMDPRHPKFAAANQHPPPYHQSYPPPATQKKQYTGPSRRPPKRQANAIFAHDQYNDPYIAPYYHDYNHTIMPHPNYDFAPHPVPGGYPPYESPEDIQPVTKTPDDTNKGTFALDSAAYPTHIATPHKITNPLTIHTTHTASGSIPCTTQKPITLRTRTNLPIKLPAVESSHLTKNLVSVHDLAK